MFVCLIIKSKCYNNSVICIHKSVTKACHPDKLVFIYNARCHIELLFIHQGILSGKFTKLVVWVLLIAMAPAYADQFDTVNYIGSVGVNYDDNIFRLPSGYDPQTYLGKSTKSDIVKVATIGISVDKKYSNQEIILNAFETINKYTNLPDIQTIQVHH